MPQPSPEDRNEERRPQELPTTSDAAGPESGVLDDVVRATIASAETDDRLTSQELAALKEVARRWGDAPFSLEPIAVELVQAIVMTNYGQLRAQQDWPSMTARIARNLYESPAANARLNNLWRRLVESL